MNIEISGNKSNLEQKLNSKINILVNPVIFDITLESSKQKLLNLTDNGKYIFSYSRAFHMGFLGLPVQDYEYVFSLKAVENNETVHISGKIKLKKYVLGALCLVFLSVCFGVYNSWLVNPQSIDWTFWIVMPSILCLYLIVGYFSFRRKAKKFIEELRP